MIDLIGIGVTNLVILKPIVENFKYFEEKRREFREKQQQKSKVNQIRFVESEDEYDERPVRKIVTLRENQKSKSQNRDSDKQVNYAEKSQKSKSKDYGKRNPGRTSSDNSSNRKISKIF